jgi:hypothetical protein
VLKRADSAVMIGDHKTTLAHEGGAATAEAHDRPERVGVQIDERGGVELKPERSHTIGYVRQLFRQPHAFVRMSGRSDSDESEEAR